MYFSVGTREHRDALATSASANDKRALLRLSNACEGKGTMLRITKVDTPTEQRLILEGRLAEPWIADLSSHWEETRRAHPERRFVVDLTGVMRTDNSGESVLALMKSAGAEFLASGLRLTHLVKDLESRIAERKARPLQGTIDTCNH